MFSIREDVNTRLYQLFIAYTNEKSNETFRSILRKDYSFVLLKGMADLILAGEGDLYDINEYHMLAHLIINKVDDFGTILAQSVHEDVVLYILVLCVSYI